MLPLSLNLASSSGVDGDSSSGSGNRTVNFGAVAVGRGASVTGSSSNWQAAAILAGAAIFAFLLLRRK